ncbi:MAG: DUF4440 domain-containing protein [Coriobacteriia bacterium]|nr:DUF4440 domain-containing protein [Coriobacteriia bacterium]
MDDHLIDKFRALEESLLSETLRKQPEKYAALLAERFTEYSSSGQVYSKQNVMDSLETLPDIEVPLKHFAATELSPGSVLVTYESARITDTGNRERALRSSIWINTNDSWELLFHQGSPVKDLVE